ncbi:MAG TPA: DNA alkylation repair protein [Chitinophagales bacterium]|nr:DNA alkylation repair protein [Chitinophagales bacterium]
MTEKQLIAYRKEVENCIHKIEPSKSSFKGFDLQHYIGTAFTVSGVKMPVARKLSRDGFSFSHLEADEQYIIWKYIWHTTDNFDTMTQAIFFCDKYIRLANPEFFFNEMCEWLQRVDNWAHSDSLTHYFAALMESHPAMVYPVLQKWNKSDFSWERRQSVLSLLDYARFRKKYPTFNKIIALVKPLLKDKDVFVQKGVGWCLRETGIIYPTETYAFLVDNHAAISSVAFSAAAEKLSPAKKEKLKSLRKKSRKS